MEKLDNDLSPSALPPTYVPPPPPPLPPTLTRSTFNCRRSSTIHHDTLSSTRPSSLLDFESIDMMQRPRRSSSTQQEEIRALLEKTTQALDKIVKIRESMEEFVDFSDYSTSKTVRFKSKSLAARLSNDSQRTSTTTATSSSSSSSSRSSARTTTSSTVIADSASSFGSSTSDALNQATSIELPSTSASHDPDDVRDSSIASDLSPFQEMRLDRLKTIEISFYEGLSKQFFHALCRFLFATVEIKTRHSRFNFYKDTFLGSDAVHAIISNGFAVDAATAIRYGNVLVKLNLIEHVSRTDDQLHNSKDTFYRFTKALNHESVEFYRDSATRMSINASNYRESVLSRESNGTTVDYDFEETSDEVHALVTDESLVLLSNVLHQVFERKNKLLFYKGFVGCFLGAEAVNVLRELRIATSLVDAIFIGQCLLDAGIIEPIATSVTSFQDKYIFYRLTRTPSA